jgi:hypothetical protein
MFILNNNEIKQYLVHSLSYETIYGEFDSEITNLEGLKKSF